MRLAWKVTILLSSLSFAFLVLFFGYIAFIFMEIENYAQAEYYRANLWGDAQIRSAVYEKLSSEENTEDEVEINDHYAQYTDLLCAVAKAYMTDLTLAEKKDRATLLSEQDPFRAEKFIPGFQISQSGLVETQEETQKKSVYYGCERFISLLGIKGLVLPPSAFRSFPSGSAASTGGSASSTSIADSAISTAADAPPVPEGASALDTYINAASEMYGIPPNMIRAVIRHESGFDPNTKNPNSTAGGYMQLLSGTARGLGLSPQQRFDPWLNIKAGTLYLSQMYQRYSGSPIAAELMLAAYYQGPGKVKDSVPGVARSYVDDVMKHFLADGGGEFNVSGAGESTGSSSLGANVSLSDEEISQLKVVIEGYDLIDLGERYVETSDEYNTNQAADFIEKHASGKTKKYNEMGLMLYSMDEKFAEKVWYLYASQNDDVPAPGFISGDGEFILPVAYTRLSSPFGYRIHPIQHVRKLHTGIDLSAPMMAPIYASKSGTVTRAGWSNGYGNLVIIDHGGGISTYYAHNTSLNVKVGDVVAQGQQIAYCGSTGNSTGPHCHFEVRVNGTPQDPKGFLDFPPSNL